jgi:hypothetical protein
MSPRRPKPPTCYVVTWPQHGVFKIGYTATKRWTRFVWSGAEVVALHEYWNDWRAGYQMEEYLQRYAGELYPPAFREPTPLAHDLLGSKAGGYLECYAGDGHEFHALMLKHCSLSIARIGDRASSASTATDVTDERTDADRFSPTGDISRSVTRTRTYGDFPDWSQP